jgi:BioD-like phosphotransacetylase family protein
VIEDFVVGAMGVNNVMPHLQRGVLLITPGDREDIILAAGTAASAGGSAGLAGLVLTGGLRPASAVQGVIETMPFPVLLARQDAFAVASRVHDMTVKTRPEDQEKIALIRDLIAKHIRVERILESL